MAKTNANFLAALLVVALAIAWPTSGQPADARVDLLKQVGIDQHPGAQVPGDLVFTDEAGQPVHLKDFFGRSPVILTLVYYGCPMLCTAVLNDLSDSMNMMPGSAGEQFDILTISFDPAEKPDLARRKKDQYLKNYNRPTAEAGWHFLTGDASSIRQLTDTVGFRYIADPQPDPMNPTQQQYIHAGGLIVLTPSGKVSRYFYGVTYAPKDLQLALAEASEGKSRTVGNAILLYCFKYDAHTGMYTPAVFNLLKVCGALTVLVLGLFLLRYWRRDLGKA
jgi:protein SCO1/2